MKWTQAIPTKSGYYWFAMSWEDPLTCIYFEVKHDVVETYGWFYNDPLQCDGSEGYFFSSESVQPLEWI